MSDHPSASSVKVSVGAKNPKKPSGKPFTFGLPNEMYLADIYNHIRNPPAEDHIAAIKELQEFVDQHQGTINELKLRQDSLPPGGTLNPKDQKELDRLEKEITEQKQWLRCFCWSGIFDTSKGAPKNKDLKQHSGRLQIDIDWKYKTRIESEELRDRLGKDPHIEASLLSPTGRGVKCGLLIPICANDAEHKQAYFAAERYFKETHKIKVDPACKDVRRVCYFSHDPKLITNPNAVPLDIEKWSPDKKKPRSLFNAATYGKTSTEPQTAGTEDKDEVLLDAGEGIYDNSSPQPPTEPPESSPSPKQQKSKQSNREYDDLSTDELVDIINHIKGVDDYDTWIKVGHAIKEHLDLEGYDLWVNWSKQSSKWNDVDEGKNWVRWVGFNPTNINGIADLIYLAKDSGWKWENTKGQKPTEDQQKTSADADHPAQEEKGTSTGAETEATETDSVEETPPSTEGTGSVKRTGNYHFKKVGQGKEAKLLVDSTLHNVYEELTIQKAPIWFDSFLRQYRTTAYQDDGIDVEMNDNIITEITLSFQRAFEGPMRRLSDKLVHKAVELYGSKDERNCLTNWLDSLQWDKTPRLDHWLSRYCGAEDNVYVREVSRCWLLGAVARAYKPGCKFDFCLVLEGEQGIGKSTALEILSNGWIVQLKTFDDKKAIENIQGKWIVEIEELDAFRKSETETIKSFISASKDRYCLKYIKYAQDWPRTCVFAGTTNKTDYLKDETGNRRFWPVWCNHIDLEALANDRDQLLAEAVHRYRQNEPMLLNQEAQGIAKEQQDDRYAGDVWEEIISSYVENKKEIKMSELFEHLGFSEAKDYTRWDQTRLGKIMSKLNWEKRRSSAPGRPTVYRSPTSK